MSHHYGGRLRHLGAETMQGVVSTVTAKEHQLVSQGVQQEVVTTGPTKGTTRGKVIGFHLAGNEIHCKEVLTCVKLTNCWIATVL